MDAVMGAMAKAMPTHIPAAGCGHANIFLSGGKDNSGRRFTGALGGPLRSGMGARPTKDGIDVADHELSNVYHVPIEVAEAEFPVRYKRMGLWTDSGGAGQWRGGLGFAAEIAWLEGDAVLSIRHERHKFQPWGLNGGQSSPVCRIQLHHDDGSSEQVPAKIVQPIRQSDTFCYWSTGGGGHGLPISRPVETVVEDVLDGRVSVEAASGVYGVVFKDGILDPAATEKSRALLASEASPAG